jgi:hypothetical protein
VKIRKRDLLWILAYPLYQTVGTVRHEIGHGIIAWLEGATITGFDFLPTIDQQAICWGTIHYLGTTNWLVTAAPYFFDLLTFGIFFWLCMTVKFPRRWVWINTVIFGLVSPWADTYFNYIGFILKTNDIGKLLLVLPPFAVHGYMVMMIVLYGIGLGLVLEHATRRP